MPVAAICISVVNQKGGVGKTTTAVNLAVALAARGNRVLLLDYDPQGNASQFLGLGAALEAQGVYTAVSFTLDPSVPFAPFRNVCAHQGLDLVGSNDTLADLELHLLRDSMGAATRLAQAVARISQQYDYVIADCPPTLGMLAINAMAACPHILIPVKLEPASLPGAVRLAGHLQGLREKVNPQIRLLGVLGTFHRETGTMARDVLQQLELLFPGDLLRTRIHDSAAVGKSAGQGEPILTAAPNARAAAEHHALTDELLALLASRSTTATTQQQGAA
jgi:chromosome partitioning protein